MLNKFFTSVFICLSALCFGAAGDVQQTLSIIKPDAVAANHIGGVISKFESENLHIAGMKMVRLTQPQVKLFYAEHVGKPFFADLADFMTSGPVVVMVLEGPNAIEKNRTLMGATDPQKANEGTLRKLFATSVTKNAVHGSDSPESAKREIAFFFKPQEIVNGHGK